MDTESIVLIHSLLMNVFIHGFKEIGRLPGDVDVSSPSIVYQQCLHFRSSGNISLVVVGFLRAICVPML